MDFQKGAFMFRPVKPSGKATMTLNFEGNRIPVYNGDTIATALLRAGENHFRDADKLDPRAPFCMMGTCFECLVEIDGKSNQQACQTLAKDGMTIRRQMAPATTGHEPESAA